MTSVQIPRSPGKRIAYGGQLVLTCGINDWIATGCEPYSDEPTTYSLEWRRHIVSVLLTSHLSGDQLDTCDEDHLMNQAVFNAPGEGGRIVSLLNRCGISKIFCITDNYGSTDGTAVTTVLFASEY